jgi:hypothetical protein
MDGYKTLGLPLVEGGLYFTSARRAGIAFLDDVIGAGFIWGLPGEPATFKYVIVPPDA